MTHPDPRVAPAVIYESGSGSLEEASEASMWRDRWQRAAADLENLRKRVEREKTLARRRERETILRDCLEVLDNLDRALAAPEAGGNVWIEGVEGTRRQLLEVLGRHGVKAFEAARERFDPSRHEAVGVRRQPGREDGEILEVYQPGYLIDDGLLRPARVIVNQLREN